MMNFEENMEATGMTQETENNYEAGSTLANRSALRSIEGCMLAALVLSLETQGDLNDRQKKDFEDKCEAQFKEVYDISDKLAKEIVTVLLMGVMLQLATREPTDLFLGKCAEKLNEEGLRPRFMDKLCMVAKHG